MKELGCKRLISWKRGCKGDVPLPFAKKERMSFGGLEHHNKLLEGANLIIVSCQRRR
jgi:hypothetical protein